MDLGQVVLRLGRLREFRDGFRQIVRGYGSLRVQPKSRLELMKRRTEAALLQQNDGLVHVSREVIRVESQRTGQAVQGMLSLAKLLQTHAQKGVRRARSWIQFDGLLQLSDGFGSLACIP